MKPIILREAGEILAALTKYRDRTNILDILKLLRITEKRDKADKKKEATGEVHQQ